MIGTEGDGNGVIAAPRRLPGACLRPRVGASPRVREQARWWLRTAEGDVDAARILLDAGRFNLCAFHTQQAAEKALKAVLATPRSTTTNPWRKNASTTPS